MSEEPATGHGANNPAIEALFGERTDLARVYAGHLASTAVERGLVGPREVPRLWERHILNCAVVGELIPQQACVADIGSGAGLPGLAVALARPDLSVILVEPLQRRVQWLTEVIEDLHLDHVAVVRGRAEELAGEVSVDIAMARAVAGLAELATWCLPLVRPGGHFLALKGRTAADELRSSERALRQAGAAGWELLRAGGSLLEEPTTVVRIRAGDRGGRERGGREREQRRRRTGKRGRG
ncbi:MAG: rRNA (guanine527-N7)-methyltransferase [Actinomycetota bacterium]|nr:rRNA (guanine527-N7)-methyltransferase [Actinomycetota bacterium]